MLPTANYSETLHISYYQNFFIFLGFNIITCIFSPKLPFMQWPSVPYQVMVDLPIYATPVALSLCYMIIWHSSYLFVPCYCILLYCHWYHWEINFHASSLTQLATLKMDSKSAILNEKLGVMNGPWKTSFTNWDELVHKLYIQLTPPSYLWGSTRNSNS